MSTVTVCEVGLRLVQYNLCTPELTGWCMRACACACVSRARSSSSSNSEAAPQITASLIDSCCFRTPLGCRLSRCRCLPPFCDLLLSCSAAVRNATRGSQCQPLCRIGLSPQPAQRYSPTLGMDSASLAVVVVVVVPALPALTLTGCACCRSISGILGILGCNPSSTSCSRWVLAVWCDALRTCLPPWSRWASPQSRNPKACSVSLVGTVCAHDIGRAWRLKSVCLDGGFR